MKRLGMRQVTAALCGMTLAVTMTSAQAADEQPVMQPAAQAAATTATIDLSGPEVALVQKMARYYEGLEGFRANVDISVNMLIEGNSRKEAVTQTLALKAPNCMLIEMKDETSHNKIVSTGKTIYNYDGIRQEYVEAETPDNLFARFSQGPGLANPLTVPFLMGRAGAGAELIEGADLLQIVGKEKVDEIECQHLRIDKDGIKTDVWVREGDKPVVEKELIDMASGAVASGEAPPGTVAEVTVRFRDIEVNPAFEGDAFDFTPPAEAKKIETSMAGEEMEHPLTGMPAPDFTLDLLDGGPVHLADFKDKNVVILDFWATWCGPCRQAMPIVAEVAKSFEQQGVKLFAVNLKEESEAVREFLKTENIEVPVLMDKTGNVGTEYTAMNIPQTVVIGKDGTVVKVHIGSQDVKEELTKAVQTALGIQSEEPAAPPAPAPEAGKQAAPAMQ